MGAKFWIYIYHVTQLFELCSHVMCNSKFCIALLAKFKQGSKDLAMIYNGENSSLPEVFIEKSNWGVALDLDAIHVKSGLGEVWGWDNEM